MVRNQAIPRNLEIVGCHCKVSYYGQAKECGISEKTGHIAEDCAFRGKCLRCDQPGHIYRDCRNEPVVATTPGPPELPVDLEDNQTGEAMESDSLLNRTVPPFEFVPASIVSSDGFLTLRRRAKRKRAKIFESNDIANVDNWLMIIMAILPVMKTVRPLRLLLMMSTVIVTILLVVNLVTTVS